MGFTEGVRITDDSGLLVLKDRQTVKTITFSNLSQVFAHEETIRNILQEALVVEEDKKAKKALKIGK